MKRGRTRGGAWGVLSGPIHLKSHVNLHLLDGATIGSPLTRRHAAGVYAVRSASS